MEIVLADHRGFCYGVKRAVKLATNCANGSCKAYTLGPIIHNPQLVARLADQGVEIAHSVEDVNNCTLIIRSHGTGPETYKIAAEKNINLVDATCPHVKNAQQAAKQLVDEGYSVVIVGEADHQ